MVLDLDSIGRDTELAKKEPVKKVDRMMQFFTYAHLPQQLQIISQPFCDLAEFIVDALPSNPERTAALRHLLEAKDSAVRAHIYKD